MTVEEKIPYIVEALEKEYPDPTCALRYEKDYQLLFAVRLSAQCTDERVNKITPALFERYPDLQDFADADIADVEQIIHSCGFFRAKAKDIVLSAKMLLSDYGGRVPDSMEALVRLPGVGRKTANLLLGDIHKLPGSVVVDTHCIRISNLLGLADTKEPVKIEHRLRQLLPPEKSNDFCHRIVLHGRAICVANRPKCDRCPLAPYCRHMTGE